MPQALQVTRSNCGALLICYQKHTLLHADPSSVLLKVEQVLRVLGQRSCHGVVVGFLAVRYILKVLLPHGVLLIPNREKCDR
jgi:hypothetical protein